PGHFRTVVLLRLVGSAGLLLTAALTGARSAERWAEGIAILAVASTTVIVIGLMLFAAGPGDRSYLIQAMGVVFLVMGTGLFFPVDGRTMIRLAGIPVFFQILATLDFPFVEHAPVLAASLLALIVAVVAAENSFA